MNLAERILQLFKGRPDCVAVPNGPGFRPHQLDEPMRPEWLDDHLGGKRCLGFYLMTEDSRVWCTAVDFDNKPDNPDEQWQEKTEAIYYELVGLGLDPLVEISQSGCAAHVWLFLEKATPAATVRKFWYAAAESADVSLVEVYPRQDRLSGKGLGNLIRYPLFSFSRFVCVESDWEPLDAMVALQGASPVSGATLAELTFRLTGKPAGESTEEAGSWQVSRRVDALIGKQFTLLGRRWRGDMDGLNDKSRSALVQSIACELVRNYVPTGEIEAAIRHWCDANAYDKGGRDDWVAGTVQRAYEFLAEKPIDRTDTWTMEDAASQYVREIREGIPPCYGTGIDEVDRSIDGVAPGEMCVVAARPSHGKTAFGMQWVDYAAVKGTPCLLISEEMSKRELGKRALLHISELDAETWGGQEDRLADQVREHYAYRAKVYGVESAQNIDAVEKLVDHYVYAHGVKLVAVDYLQLLGSEHAARYDSVTDISRRLKQIASRLSVAMVVLCQLNREVEKRVQHEPQLSDLRESGQIEQDADLVLMLQWVCRYDAKEDPNKYRVWCSKRRNGPIRTPLVETEFYPERQKFGRPTVVDNLPGSYSEMFG